MKYGISITCTMSAIEVFSSGHLPLNSSHCSPLIGPRKPLLSAWCKVVNSVFTCALVRLYVAQVLITS